MSLLPAVVPDIPEARAELAAARIARKVAPLFGVAWPGGPFGARSWVSDYGKITLSEIARGAPLPTRSQAASLSTAEDRDWQLVDRVAVTRRTAALPHEIANATLNRFGPDTKAAVVLTATNRLLSPVTEAITAALPLVVGVGPTALPPTLRIAAWAGLMIEVFRSQPALVGAGIRARTIQRELVAWSVPLAAGLDGLPLTRCELGAAATSGTEMPSSPRSLDVADQTFRMLGLRPGWQQPHSTEPDGRLLDDGVDLLLRRLLAVGTPNDASHLWLSEREPGQLVLEAHLPPTPIVDLFVRRVVRMLGLPDEATDRERLPVVPTPDRLAPLPTLARRAVLIGLLTVLRSIQFDDAGRDATRGAVLDTLHELNGLAVATLSDDDPLQALARCRIADMVVQTVRVDTRNDLTGPVAQLLAAARRVRELFQLGIVDRGAAAEALSSANVELNAVRWTCAGDPGAAGVTAAELHAELRTNWQVFREALQLGSIRAERAAGYHLHNYAAFLASPKTAPDPGGDADLRESIRLFTDVVLPARAAFHAATGVFRPLRHSLQVASRATTRLAADARRRGDQTAERSWAELGLGWILRVLDHADTARTLSAEAIPTERAVRLALLTVPALLTAVRAGVPGAGASELETARRHLRCIEAWEATIGGGQHHARHGEVVALQAELNEPALLYRA